MSEPPLSSGTVVGISFLHRSGSRDRNEHGYTCHKKKALDCGRLERRELFDRIGNVLVNDNTRLTLHSNKGEERNASIGIIYFSTSLDAVGHLPPRAPTKASFVTLLASVYGIFNIVVSSHSHSACF